MIVDAAGTTDPLLRARRAVRVWGIVFVALGVPLGVWALLPAAPSAVADVPPQPIPRAASVERPPLSMAAFDAPIWTLDPPAPVPAAPPAPLRLRLVGLVREGEGGVLKAVVFDPDLDGLFVVGEGDSVGNPSRRVQSVDSAGITLADGAGTRRVLLEPGP